MTNTIIIGISVFYILMIIVHLFAFIQYANKHYAQITAAHALLIFGASFFWWAAWIYYGIERIRGRVA